MRIAIVNWNRRKVGGAEAYLDTIIPDLLNAGHQVGFFHETDEPISHPQISLPEDAPSWCVAKYGSETAIKELRGWNPDVIYAHGLLDSNLESSILEVAPAVFFAHSYYGSCISGSKAWSNNTVRPCHRTFGPLCLLHYFPHRCGGLNPLSMIKEYRRQSRRLDLLHRYKYVLTGSNHMRVEFANHGLNSRLVPLFAQASTSLPAGVHSPTHWRLLFLGRMDRLKGGLTLLDSLPAIIHGLDRRLHVIFAGDGPDRELWESRAASLAAAYDSLSFDFPGWVTGDAHNSLLADADLLVMPSLWPEPFGLSGPEAGLRGVPAAAFDVGGISDWLKDGINGYLAPADPPTAKGLAEAVIKCLKDPVEYQRLRAGAETIAQRLTARNHVSELLEVLGESAAAKTQ
jgi:glycosyltransferase involved in cell wall biosynthesis